MEDVKWLLKKCGLPILILLFAVIAGVICWGKLHTEERKVAAVDTSINLSMDLVNNFYLPDLLAIGHIYAQQGLITGGADRKSVV